jgi:hypothetical protein
MSSTKSDPNLGKSYGGLEMIRSESSHLHPPENVPKFIMFAPLYESVAVKMF